MKNGIVLGGWLLSSMLMVACSRDEPTDTETAFPAAESPTAVETASNQPALSPPDLSVRAPPPVIADSGMSFTDMDKNMDSGVTPDELASGEALHQHFNDADTNNDGHLSLAEVERYRSDMAGGPTSAMTDTRSFSEIDKNADGSITHDELRDTEMLERHFDEADTDQDGRLSATEVDAHRAAMAAGD